MCKAPVAGTRSSGERVEKLLQAHFRAGNFLEPSATTLQPAIDQAIQEGPGTVIGPYKLLQQIGEGGMGVVFLAEQSRPVQRKVALKIIKPGMDTRQVIARFAAEQQALALMDHPNIARVFDAGATESGRPYFVMELVKGVPITEYCDQQHLTPQQRLELFIPICHALQHAHQKGIIHRDLKPSNVLVALYDGRPVPKVIDFGVAKATGPKLTERTMFTEIGQVVGTLEYMSPEQAELNQLDVDTRSDIYSLGVLLYELLTGTTPFERKRLKAAAFLEMLRIIREEEPPKPSTRLSTTEGLPSIAANRSLRAEKAERHAAGRSRLDRDEGVGERPVAALRNGQCAQPRPASGSWRMSRWRLLRLPRAHRVKRFVRRNKRTVVAAAAVVTALLVGIIGTSLGLLQAQRQRTEAVMARDDAVTARDLANRATQQTQHQLATTTLQRALALCEQGEITRGVLWLGRASGIGARGWRRRYRARLPLEFRCLDASTASTPANPAASRRGAGCGTQSRWPNRSQRVQRWQSAAMEHYDRRDVGRAVGTQRRCDRACLPSPPAADPGRIFRWNGCALEPANAHPTQTGLTLRCPRELCRIQSRRRNDIDC